MKRKCFLATAIVFAALMSCTKESELDQAIVSAINTQSPIEFTAYTTAIATTKGAAINSNATFQSPSESTSGSFDVTALVSDCTPTLTYVGSSNSAYTGYYMTLEAGNAVKYFGFRTVNYSSVNSKWENFSDMYWPNESRVVHFAAYSPSGLITSKTSADEYGFSVDNAASTLIIDEGGVTTGTTNSYTYKYFFPYTVNDDVAKQEDIMYAMTSYDYLAPTDKYKSGSDNSYITVAVTGVDTNDEEAINLHFKHALTQIAFTATKDEDLKVYVKSITLCNLYNSGTFTATSVTDDDDADAVENPTVGDGDSDNGSSDMVNANNFGSWETYFAADGWDPLRTETNANSGAISYYTTSTTGHTSMSNYTVPLASLSDKSLKGDDAIEISPDATTPVATILTDTENVMMLIPQKLTPWIPTSSNEPNFVGWIPAADDTYATKDVYTTQLSDGSYASSTKDNSLSYLAIDCEIYHSDATAYAARIHDGYIFVPFETKDLDYSKVNVDNVTEGLQDKWLPGYKVSYTLNFGGGYVVDEDNHTDIPSPGCIPDTKTYTLRTITYTTTCDDWVEQIDGGSQDLEDYDTSTSASTDD